MGIRKTSRYSGAIKHSALMRSRASQRSLDQQGGCLSEASFRHVQTHREAQGTRRAKHVLAFCLVRLLWANKINERPHGSGMKTGQKNS
jgi:hypothetical protein